MMTPNIKNHIDVIASNYFKSTSLLFDTVTFFNISVECVYTDKNEKLIASYNKLKNTFSNHAICENSNPADSLLLKHMPSLCFSSLVSAFENYLIEMLVLTLTNFPKKIAKETIDMDKLIELTKEEIILYKANEYINKIMYKSPKDYLKSLSSLLSLNEQDIASDFNHYIEIKARRDLGVHNNWRKNEIYERKVAEAGIKTPNVETLMPDLYYFKDSFYTCSKLVKEITNQCCVNMFKIPSVFDNKNQLL